jgi:hypothetical protein
MFQQRVSVRHIALHRPQCAIEPFSYWPNLAVIVAPNERGALL